MSWAWRMIPGENAERSPIFSVIAKRTYNIVPRAPAVWTGNNRPLADIDEYYDDGDPQVTSVQFESDLTPYKLGTDVVLIGTAYAPDAKPVQKMNVSISVESHKKNLLITGDRFCQFRPDRDPTFTEPISFTQFQLRYEYAYGGNDFRSFPEMPLTYPRNPVGRGFVVRNSAENIEGMALPNIEDPTDPLTPERVVVGDPSRWNQQPFAHGLGWLHRAWYPRCSFLAAMPAFVPVDEVMREAELGIVPRNQAELAAAFRLPSCDSRFFSGASLGLVLPYMQGGESIALENLTPGGTLSFQLPSERPAISMDIGLGQRSLESVLHSVTIIPDKNEVDLVWRAAQTYPGIDWLPEMKCMRVCVE